MPVRGSVILLAGPSGSGKSRVARLASCPALALDDFYRDHDHPGLPRAHGIVDWDDLASWDPDGAMAALARLCTEGEAEVPTYDIALSRRTGTRVLRLGSSGCVVAEGLFAADLVTACRRAGLLADALYLHRPRAVTLAMRLVRDVREQRKPIGLLIRRGLALCAAEPAVRATALARGCRPVSLREALEVVEARMQTKTP